MEMALTLVSIASFFALVLAWIVMPATEAPRAAAVKPVTSPQTAA
jgi:hypothetical protein